MTRFLAILLTAILTALLTNACAAASSTPFYPVLLVRPTPASLFPATGATTWELPGQPDITAMRETMVTVLRANELEFNLGYPVQGFSADPVYPRLFVRDTSTLLTGASYFYPAERLKWGVEAFLRQQYDDTTASSEDGWRAGFGAISATIGPDKTIDKATTVSDEESHFIHAAYTVYAVHGGAAWLAQDINGLPILDRLNAAGAWLLLHRRDQATGLIFRDHTTDWGDIRFQPTAGNPTDIVVTDAVWTASIYDQALAYRAWRELAEMNNAVGNETAVQHWDNEAEALRRAANAYLWQPERGFYRTHLHLTLLRHKFDEDGMVSIANAVAIRCGLTDAGQEAAIIAALEEARLAAGAAKPGVSLYPPYPPGFFAITRLHYGPAYQNGGLWDWWGGWQVLAEFESGYSDLARAHLRQTAADWAKHPGQVFEWQYADTLAGQGGNQYAGAAGVYAQVIIEGLYGVHLSLNDPALTPRLGDWPGRIAAYQPASGLYLRYAYQPAAANLTLTYETNDRRPSWPLRLLLPSGFTPVQARIDQTAIVWQSLTKGRDTYLTAALPTGRHVLVIEK